MHRLLIMGLRLLLVSLPLLAMFPGAAAADDTVGTVHRITALSAWHGHVVFSAYDAVTQRWSLMQIADGAAVRLAVPAARQPFDADVGPNARREPVAVFTRCPGGRGPGSYEPGISGSRDCRIHQVRLDLAGAPERTIAAVHARGFSDGTPTIWNGRIAFARVQNRGTMAALFIQTRPGDRHLVRLGRGTIPRCPPSGTTTGRCFRVAVPAALDLGATRLAFTWYLAGGNAYAQEDEELWSSPLDGRSGRLLDVGGAGECGFGGEFSFRRFSAPSMSAGRVSYLAQMGDCYLTRSTFTQTGPTAQRRSERVAPSGTLAYGAARDGRAWWWLRGPAIDPASVDDPCLAEPGCAIIHSPRIALHRVPVDRHPRPPVDTMP